MTKTQLFEAPNLDALTICPQEMDDAQEVLTTLAEYARMKAQAMRQRMRGNIEGALIHEATCERIYALLPQWARW